MDNNRFSRMLQSRISLVFGFSFVLVAVIAWENWLIAIPFAGFWMALALYGRHTEHQRRQEITRYIENLTFHIEHASKDTLIHFPMPLVVVELDGRIVWYNSSFRNIFDGESLLERTIHQVIDDLKEETLSAAEQFVTRDIVIGAQSFRVFGNFVRVSEPENNVLLLLYLVDRTECATLTRQVQDERTVVGVLTIDNYDDLMGSVEDSKRPMLLAEIDRKVFQWSNITSGIMKKYERDKYLFIFEQRFLKDFEEKRFDLLDGVKEIQIGNKIPVTLSMGFGLGGLSPAQNFQSAIAALDIALGRGGDQVVIRNGDQFSFFGGKTRELEKRTKVKARVIAYALRELIDQAPDVYVMGHENGDLDSLGSSLGIYRLVRNRGKACHVVLSRSNASIDQLVNRLRRSEDHQEMFIDPQEALNRISRKSLVIVVDVHRPSFTECPELLKVTDQRVVIDHHRKGTEFVTDAVLTYMETYASSTSELVTEILQYVEERIRLKGIEAEALYAGLVLDTKNFTFKTGVRTFEAAAFLRRQGVDPIAVRQLFQNDIATYSAIAQVVQSAEIFRDTMAISACQPGTRHASLVAAQAADQLLSLSGMTAAFVLSQSGNEVSVSGRSLGDINVQVILERLGGGGHLTVAGAQLEGVSLDEARIMVKTAVTEYLDTNHKSDNL